MKPRRRFALPPPPDARAQPGWAVVSGLLHIVVIALLVAYSGPTFKRVTVIFVEIGSGPDVREIELPPVEGSGEGRPEARVGGRADGDLAPREVVLVPPTETPSALPPLRRDEARPREGLPGEEPPGAEELVTVGRLGFGPGRRILGPRLGDGRLWVRPRDAILAAIAEALGEAPIDTETHFERLDSAVAALILAFVDTLARDSLEVPKPPSWTTEIAGETWGIDGSWIYLGGLKLPTMILALLPLPQGNYEQAQQAAELARIRQNIMRAAQRAQDMAQFKRYVAETRRRRERERDRERNRGVVPKDSVKT